MASPFSGAWRDVSDTHDGFYLLTETHFCYLWAEKGRRAITGAPTDDDAAALFRSMSSRAGTNRFTAQGDAWQNVSTMLVSADPASVGREVKETWAFEEGRSFMRILLPDGATFRLEKVSEAGTSPFAGAWELVSDTYEGLMLRTDAHYCAVVTRRNRPLPQVSELSVSEAAALYRGAQTAVAGSYTIDGMKTVTRTLLDRNPAMVGRESTRIWRFEDDRAIGVPEGGGESVGWRRIG